MMPCHHSVTQLSHTLSGLASTTKTAPETRPRGGAGPSIGGRGSARNESGPARVVDPRRAVSRADACAPPRQSSGDDGRPISPIVVPSYFPARSAPNQSCRLSGAGADLVRSSSVASRSACDASGFFLVRGRLGFLSLLFQLAHVLGPQLAFSIAHEPPYTRPYFRRYRRRTGVHRPTLSAGIVRRVQNADDVR